ncbi:hypothetical protein [Mucilaginibacter ginsenosidivorans]|uniref:Uncharacterized protein n=1 Tax=Mucilaginibacter ginsenosidivorans TaxID=398053 RepID=A0A5B8UTY0_9SPHI|nr:hypothetical protein [Mucilaginibacter ginsenosidivorans]QEC62494.1 hypothetical protein FRZ54_07800 [Mucilaginibacter ginsenosidivorans]
MTRLIGRIALYACNEKWPADPYRYLKSSGGIERKIAVYCITPAKLNTAFPLTQTQPYRCNKKG